MIAVFTGKMQASVHCRSRGPNLSLIHSIRRSVVIVGIALIVFPACHSAGTAGDGASRSPVVVTSPNEQVRVELHLHAPHGGEPTYRILFHGQEFIAPSSLSIRLADGTILGPGAELRQITRRTTRDEFDQPSGKRRHVVSLASEVTLFLRNSTHEWQLICRVADDGAALRYSFPGDAATDLVITDERTTFRVPSAATVTALPLASFTTSHEGLYRRTPAPDVPFDQLIALPILIELPGIGCAAITEAALDDYAGMYLVREHQSNDKIGSTELLSRLSPRPGDPGVAVRARRPHASPWRVLLLADAPAKLIESDFVLALNKPCALPDMSWILPGKTTFPWWNAYVDPAVPFDVGLNTQTMKYYIDFCAAHGIPYHTLDGKDDLAWYGGPISWKGDDPTTPIDTIDLPAVLAHARQRGVGIRVWMHWKAAQAHMDRAFPLYHQWGIRGVMLDFMDRDDQEMVNFLRRALQLAAANQLTVVLHGVAKPTGLERTFPHLLGSEGVWNLEYDKWDKAGCTPEHEMTAIYTRMLAGPMDFHQGGTRTVPVNEFVPRWEAPIVMGTPVRTLASYIVYQNHLAMIADYPSAYAEFPLLKHIVSVPDSWDDTIAIAGEVGEYVVIARRSGDTWWVAAMTNSSARVIDIPLSFLGPGRYTAEVFEDDGGESRTATTRTQEVDRLSPITANLQPSGAWVARVTPLR